MTSDRILVMSVILTAAALTAGLGLPLAFALVRPNSIYGFRTAATLRDAAVWYPVNRVTGLWCIAIGATTAGVSLGTFLSALSMPAAAIISAGTLVAGVVAMAVHGLAVCARLTRAAP
jgi:uncharacterized membrane protein